MLQWKLYTVFSGVYFLGKGLYTQSHLPPSAKLVFSLSSYKLPIMLASPYWLR